VLFFLSPHPASSAESNIAANATTVNFLMKFLLAPVLIHLSKAPENAAATVSFPHSGSRRQYTAALWQLYVFC